MKVNLVVVVLAFAVSVLGEIKDNPPRPSIRVPLVPGHAASLIEPEPRIEVIRRAYTRRRSPPAGSLFDKTRFNCGCVIAVGANRNVPRNVWSAVNIVVAIWLIVSISIIPNTPASWPQIARYHYHHNGS
jgi:hypothetical protein